MPFGQSGVRMKQPKLLCPDGKAAKALRLNLGLNQTDFWGRVGVVQSGGSRYESDRGMPEQVAWALHLAYGTEAQAAGLVRWLRSDH